MEFSNFLEIKLEVFEDGAVIKQKALEDFAIVLPKQEERGKQLVESQLWTNLLEEVEQEAEDEDQALLEVLEVIETPTTSKRKKPKLSPTAAVSFPCEICRRTFSYQSKLELHMRVVHKVLKKDQGLRRLKCHLCEGRFNRKWKLDHHLKHHERVPSFPNCDVEGCTKTFTSIVPYFQHKRAAHPDISKSDRKQLELIPCGKCDEVSTSQSGVTLHKKFHEDFSNYPACHFEGCTSTFTSSIEAKAHKLSEHTDFICQLCNIQLLNKNKLRKHMRQVHPKKMGRTKKKMPVHNCHMCEQVFTSTKELLTHVRRHQDFPTFPNCDVEGCPETFKLISDFLRHGREVHPRPPPQPSIREAIKCDKCDLICFNGHHSRVHQMFHRNFPTFPVCHFEGCGQTFKSRIDINNHKYKKHSVVPLSLQCDLCPKSFTGGAKKWRLISHLLTRHVEKAHWKSVCEVCEKRFPLEWKLRAHMRKLPRNHPSEFDDSKSSESRTSMKTKLRERRLKASECKKCGGTHSGRNCRNETKNLKKSSGQQFEFVSLKVEADPLQGRDHLPKGKRKLKKRGSRVLYEPKFFCEVCDKPFLFKIRLDKHMRSIHKWKRGVIQPSQEVPTKQPSGRPRKIVGDANGAVVKLEADE